MDFTIAKIDLVSILSKAASAAASKSPIPTHLCVLLDARDGKLTARATDLMVGIESSVACVVKEPGCYAIDAKRAAQIADKLPAGDVRIRDVKNQIEIKSGKAVSKVGWFPSEDFPPLPASTDATPCFVLTGNDLTRVIANGAYAVGTDESRPGQCATLFSPEADGLRVFSTDSARFASAYVKCEVLKVEDFLMPTRGLAEVKNFAKAAKDRTISVSRANGTAFLTCGNDVLSVKLNAEDIFPPVRKMIFGGFGKPVIEHTKHWCTADRSALVDAAKRVELTPKLSVGNVPMLRLTFDAGIGELVVSGESGSNSGTDSVSVDACPTAFLDLSPHHINQALQAIPDDVVRIGLGESELHPFVLMSSDGSTDSIQVISPMKP